MALIIKKGGGREEGGRKEKMKEGREGRIICIYYTQIHTHTPIAIWKIRSQFPGQSSFMSFT